MTHPVRYYCPHCGAVVELDREGYLSDKSVTPYPLVGWEYCDPGGKQESADGIRLVCGESGTDTDGVRWTGDRVHADDVAEPTAESPCGRELFLSFVRFENGEEVEPRPEPTYTEIAADGPRGSGGPSGPDQPRGPGGPSGFSR